MKIATWNVNSLNVRKGHVLDWLRDNPVDVLCLQELKQEDGKFPQAELAEAGYQAIFAGQRTYNGVAILSRTPASNVEINLANFPDEQKRLIAADISGMRVVCVYVPNGQEVGSEKYEYKLRWLNALSHWLDEAVRQYPKLVILGDFNIAPADQDVHDPAAWLGQVLVSGPERAALLSLMAHGLHDAYREQHPDQAEAFTWWDYRMNCFRRNLGVRIDHILLSEALLPKLQGCEIDRTPRTWERPSDHTPVIATITT